MKTPWAIVVATIAMAFLMLAPATASAGGRYYGYGYGYGYGCCCPSYCCGWVRGRGFNRPYAYSRYGYYGYRYPLARGYARREALRGW